MLETIWGLATLLPLHCEGGLSLSFPAPGTSHPAAGLPPGQGGGGAWLLAGRAASPAVRGCPPQVQGVRGGGGQCASSICKAGGGRQLVFVSPPPPRCLPAKN